MGQPRYVDPCFFAVTLAFLFAGAYWLSRSCVHYRLHPAWGLCFALTPGVLTSIDRMTIDLAREPCAWGFGLYAAAEPSWKVFPVLVLAPLVRETGLLLILGYCLFLLLKRHWIRALWCSTAAVPYLGWVLFVHRRTAPDFTTWVSFYPLSGLIHRTLQPVQYALSSRWVVTAAILDYAGVLGIWVALALTVTLAWRRFGPIEIALAASTLAVTLATKPDIWSGA